jgi:hypothetical protein
MHMIRTLGVSLEVIEPWMKSVAFIPTFRSSLAVWFALAILKLPATASLRQKSRG